MLERTGPSWDVDHDLVFKRLIEAFEMTEYEFSAKGHVDVLPMEDLRVVIKALQDFNF